MHAPTRAQRRATERRREPVIRVRDLVVGFGDKLVMNGLDLDVYRGEVLGFVGGSGQGKSVLTRTILGLVAEARGRDRGLRRGSRRAVAAPSGARSSSAGACCSRTARCSPA